MITIPTGKENFEKVCRASGLPYSMEKSISGYYRLLLNDELIHDDSACEDVQEEESAYYFFAQLIEEQATCVSPR